MTEKIEVKTIRCPILNGEREHAGLDVLLELQTTSRAAIIGIVCPKYHDESYCSLAPRASSKDNQCIYVKGLGFRTIE